MISSIMVLGAQLRAVRHSVLFRVCWRPGVSVLSEQEV